MKRTTIFLSVMVFVTLGALSWVWAAQDKNAVLTGEVLDLVCYLGHGAHGPGHAKCATRCLSNGAPVGLLTKDGKAYLAVEDHGAPAAYESLRKMAAEEVQVSGKLVERGGLQGIIVEKVEKIAKPQ